MITCQFENGAFGKMRHTVVDVIVIKDDQILLELRAKHLSGGGQWALPGGYVDRDERIVDAVKREVFEETGWLIKNIQLFMITDDPNRDGGNQNIAFMYLADADKKEADGDDESEEIRWFTLDEVPKNLAFDFAEIINAYKVYLKQPVPLPIWHK